MAVYMGIAYVLLLAHIFTC